MNSPDPACKSGQIPVTPEKVPSEPDKPARALERPGFALKLAFREYLLELSATGTVVALSLVGVLGLTGFGLWQQNLPSSSSAQAAQLDR
jgi:hypothetical protein